MFANSPWFKASCKVALGLSVLLVAETAMVTDAGAVVVGTVASAATPSVEQAAVKASGPVEAEDAASAALAARLQKRRIEILSERTETSTVWAEPDGTTTAEFAAGPVRFLDGAGTWHSVDPTLTADADGTVRAKSHPLNLELAGKTPEKPDTAAARRLRSADPVAASVPLVTLQDEESDRELTVGWRGGLPQPKLKGTQATYENALPDADLVVESTRTGFEQFLILKDKKAVDDAGTVRLTLDAEGMKVVKRADGSLAFTDAASGKQLGSLPAPVMWDARVDERSGEHTHRADVAMDVVQSGRNVDIILRPDTKFLNATDTQFPVTIDPAVNLGTTFTTFVQEGYNTDQSGSTELKLGNNGSGQKARSFLKFNTRPIKGKKIEAATLKLWNKHSWSCSARQWDVYDTGSVSTATRWTKQPGWNTKWATSTQTKGYSSSCGAGWVSADIKNLTQRWAENTNAENVLGIRAANEADAYSWKRFNSRNAAGNVPVIAVTYNTPPAAPTAVAIAPSNVNPSNKRRYVTSLTPAMSAKVTDADGGNVKAQFEVTPDPAFNDAGTYKYTGTSANVSSGGTAKVTIPADKKFPAAGLRFRVRGYDGKHYGAWSGYATFRVNTVKPAAPTIKCEAFSDDTWSDNPGKDSTCTLSTSSTDGRGYLWGLDDPSTPKQANDPAGTGGKPLDIKTKPSDGWHTLYARTVDSGSLVSDRTTAMAFGVGKDGAALLQPREGDRPARHTHLNARGKSEYKEVTFAYRRSDEDTWRTIPAGDVSFTSDDEPIGSWPQPVTDGRVKPMAWNLSKTLTEDGPLQVRATFGGADKLPAGHTPTSRITYDRDAGTAPNSEVGPGDVNLLTGNLALSETDASAFDLSVSRNANSRKPGVDTAAQGQAPIFGPSWTTGIESELSESDYTGLRKTSNTSVAVTFEDGDEIGFTAAKNGTWIPEIGAEEFTLTGTLTGSFTLSDKAGAVTVFRKADPSLATWQVSSSQMPEENSTTRTVSEKVTVDGKALARPKYVIAPTSAAKSETCEATPATKGCRVLEFVYATSTSAGGDKLGDYTGRVKQIRLWATSPGAMASTATAISTYAYDDKGRLREQWDPRIAPALKTAYAYDDAGRVTSYTPAGELPWTLSYGKAGQSDTAGEGMLLTAARPALKEGSASDTDGTATTRVVYDVATRGTKAPYDLSRRAVGAWGQEEAPSDASAVFPADSVPSSSDGSELPADGYRRAEVTYMDASGRQINTAQPGGHLDATAYDTFGNTVRELSASNRQLALGVAEAAKERLTELSLIDLGTAERAEKLSTVTTYSDDGQREMDKLEPTHLGVRQGPLGGSGDEALIPAGTPVPLRKHTASTYDEGRPADAKTENLLTTAKTGAAVDGYATDADVRVAKTAYDWNLGLPISEIKDADGLKLTTRTEYDAQGRVTKQTLPKSNGGDAGATITRYWTATGSGACAGRPEWAGKVCSTGPAGAITGGGGNPSELPTKTTEYDRWGNTAKLTEAANGQTRTTVTAYDGAGRATKTAVSGGQGTAVPDTATTYAPGSGKKHTVASSTGTITYTYDQLGRQIGYTDADGKQSTTAYDKLDRPVRETDSAPSTTTYTYDTTAEPRGLATKVTDSVAGAFHATYDADREVVTEKLPGGVTLARTRDETGSETARVYTRDSDRETIVSDTAVETVHDQQALHSANAGIGSSRHYTYDGAGRLTKTEDTQGERTTTRSYAFDNNANRTKLTTHTDEDGTKETAYTYDSADRLTGDDITYDAFGRTTRQGGASTGYYTNDLVHQQTQGDKRTAWSLDAVGRLAAFTSETKTAGSWGQAKQSRNHYTGDGDNPAYITDNSGQTSRNVSGIGSDLSATTTRIGGTVLQLANLHGDITATYPTDQDKTPTVYATDEYGNAIGTPGAARYGWLGAKQRSAETPTGQVLMGVRLYNPSTGRFQSMDPIPGGNANAYEYVYADPLNRYDLDGQWSWGKKWWKKNGRKWKRRALRGAVYGAAAFATAGACAATGGFGCIVAGAAIGAAGGAGDYWAKRRFGNRARYRRRDFWGSVGTGFGFGFAGGLGGAAWKGTSRFAKKGSGSRRAPKRHYRYRR